MTTIACADNAQSDAALPPVTRTLARFIVQSQPAGIPASVRHEASRGLLNWIGCAIGAARHDTVAFALQAFTPFFGAAQAQILGRPERTDVLHAALINGISSHVLDFDDTHVRAIHPSAPVLPALLAYAEWRKLSGAALVHAYVLGVEAEERVGLSVFPEHYDRGWHITGTAGVFGAAAAVGKLLGLDEQRMTWALGIAATQSAGLRDMFGSMCKSFHPGRAAQNGMGAALLAQAGFTSSESAIEAPRGFGRVMSSKFDPDVVIGRLGESYELSQNMYKPFACGLVMHPSIDGCLKLRREHDIDPARVARVDLRVNPLVLELTGKPEPKTGLESKFSIYHAAAVALERGAAGESEFSAETALDPRTIALRQRVHAVTDPRIRKLEAHVRIGLDDGTVYTRHIENTIGSVAHPMSDRDLEEKFLGLAKGILPPDRTDALIRACWEIESLQDAGEIARLAATGAIDQA